MLYISKTVVALIKSLYILGNPGATNRDDVIFLGKSLLQVLNSPWELILTEPVPEVVEFRHADWAEKYFFCPISEELWPGNSVAFLHEAVFFINRPSCLARTMGRLSWRVSEKNIQRSRGNCRP